MSQGEAPLPPAQQPKSGGSGAKWLLLIPVGCFVIILICCGGGTGIFMWAISYMKDMEMYKEAVSRATEHPDVQAALGTPIEPSYLMQGNVNSTTSTTSTSVSLEIPITGPNGSGIIYAEGLMNVADESWEYTIMEVYIESSGESIDLLE